MGARKRKILQAIIDSYIDTAEPVGSRTIAKRNQFGISSATIRNEMADLEEMGYLEQPYTSAGRIPSQLGYRLYVDELMDEYMLNLVEIQGIRNALEMKMQEINQIINQVTQEISKLTQYTTVISTPQFKKSAIKYLKIIPVTSRTALLIIITDSGTVKNQTIKTPTEVDAPFLNKISLVLNNRLKGLTVEQINLEKIREIKKEMNSNEEVLMTILEHIADNINAIDNAEVYLGGTTNIFNFPEYNDIQKAKEFFAFMEKKKSLHRLLANIQNSCHHTNNNKINIVIGAENQFEELKNCSLITSAYSIGDKVVGIIGVIGPTRMEYPKIVSSLECLTKNLDDILLNWLGEGNTD